MLTFTAVSLRYPTATIFNNLTLNLPEKRVVITGENGSGKTTLLMLAAGLVTPDAGEVTFDNHPVTSQQNKRRIGISASKVALPTFFTSRELLDFHCHMHQCTLDLTMAEQLGFSPFLQTRVSDLSLGNYKKLSLLTALLHEPDLLLLDEPTNGLDDDARHAMNTILSDFTGQLIIASHDTALLSLSFDREIPMQHIRGVS